MALVAAVSEPKPPRPSSCERPRPRQWPGAVTLRASGTQGTARGPTNPDAVTRSAPSRSTGSSVPLPDPSSGAPGEALAESTRVLAKIRWQTLGGLPAAMRTRALRMGIWPAGTPLLAASSEVTPELRRTGGARNRKREGSAARGPSWPPKPMQFTQRYSGSYNWLAAAPPGL